MISVIICHHQGDFIYKAVESIKKSELVDFEIIVVTSVKDLVIEGVKIIHLPGQPALKRNVGYNNSKGRYLAFFDDDVEVTPDALVNMHIECRKPGVGMVFGKLLNMEFKDRFDEAGGFLTWTGFIWARAESGIKDLGQYDVACHIFAGKSAACMIRSELFNHIGRFDSQMGILGEESDLAWRVWIAGQEVKYVPSSVTFHAFNTKYKPMTFYSHSRVYFNGCRNYITMLCSNLEVRNIIRILPFHLLAWLTSAIGMLFSGKFNASYHIFRGLLWVCTHIDIIKQKRVLVGNIRVMSDVELKPFIFRSPKPSYYLGRFFRYLKVGLHG